MLRSHTPVSARVLLKLWHLNSMPLVVVSPAGALVAIGDQTTFAFAVQDGKVQEVGHPYVVIQEWKIVLRGLDEHEVIFEWPNKKP